MNRNRVFFSLLFVLIIVLFPASIMLSVIFHTTELAIFIPTAVASSAAVLYPLAERYYWIPELEILYDPKDLTTYRPSLDTVSECSTSQMWVRREICRVAVRNKGKGTAKNCVAEIKLVKSMKGCQAFSNEPKPLVWTRVIGRSEHYFDPIDIARGQLATLEVVFAQQCLAVPFGGKCEIQPTSPQIRAWAGTPEAIACPKLRLQDGFCAGEFKVKVTIYSDNIEPISKDFLIKVGDSGLNIQPVACCTN